MVGYRVIPRLLVVAFLSGTLVLTMGSSPIASAQSGQLRIWTDQPTYAVGSTITYCFTVPAPGHIRITSTVGSQSQVITEWDDDGTGACISTTIVPPTGQECLRLDYSGRTGQSSTETCYRTTGSPEARPNRGAYPTPLEAAIAAVLERLPAVRGVEVVYTGDTGDDTRPCPQRTVDCFGAGRVTEGVDAAYVQFRYGQCQYTGTPNPGCDGAGLFVYVYYDSDGWHFRNAAASQGLFLGRGGAVRVSVSGGCANVRARPSAVSAIVTCLTNDTLVQIDDGPVYADGDLWWHIQGRGWMAHDFLIDRPLLR